MGKQNQEWQIIWQLTGRNICNSCFIKNRKHVMSTSTRQMFHICGWKPDSRRRNWNYHIYETWENHHSEQFTVVNNSVAEFICQRPSSTRYQIAQIILPRCQYIHYNRLTDRETFKLAKKGQVLSHWISIDINRSYNAL